MLAWPELACKIDKFMVLSASFCTCTVHPWTFPLAIALSLALWPPVECITPVTRRQLQALMEPLPSAPDSTSARVSACFCLMAVLPTAQCIATAATHSRAWLHPQHIAHSCGRWLASPPDITPALRVHPVRCPSQLFGSQHIQAVSTAIGQHARCDLHVH